MQTRISSWADLAQFGLIVHLDTLVRLGPHGKISFFRFIIFHLLGMNPANIKIGDLFLAKSADYTLWPIRILEVMTTNIGDCKFAVFCYGKKTRFFATAKKGAVPSSSFYCLKKIRVERKSQTLAQRAGRWRGNSPFHIRGNFCSF